MQTKKEKNQTNNKRKIRITEEEDIKVLQSQEVEENENIR